MKQQHLKQALIAGSILIILYGALQLVRLSTTGQKKSVRLYQTGTVTTQDLTQTIVTTGTLALKETHQVGSQISGTVKKVLVEENDTVKKGALLAVLDNGKSDTQIRIAQADLAHAQAEHRFFTAQYKRHTALHAEEFLSDEALEKTTLAIGQSEARVMRAQAVLDAATEEYTNRNIVSPVDGMVTAVGVTTGQRISVDLKGATLFEIAEDVCCMENHLHIDQSDVYQVKTGQKVDFTVDSIAHEVFEGTIKKIDFSPQSLNGNITYKAIMNVDNTKQKFRPGMSLNATIHTAQCANAHAVAISAFYLPQAAVKAVGEQLGYTVNCVTPAQREELSAAHPGRTLKTIWRVDEAAKSFTEQLVVIGISTEQYTAVSHGVKPGDVYLTDVVEKSHMDAIYKKMNKGMF